MAYVKLDDIAPGMTLAAPATAEDGRLLLPAGVELTQAHLDLFLRFGVDGVEVAMEVPDEELERAADHVRRFFHYVDHADPVMNLLFRAAVGRTGAAMGRGWEPTGLDPRLAADPEHLDDLFSPDQGGIADMVRHEQAVASFPEVYSRLRSVLEKPDATVQDLAAVVQTDAGLSARLLRLVNSPFYGFSASIDSVERAVTMVGMAELSTLALGITTIAYFEDIPRELVDMKTFWRHSLGCAILCAALARRAGDLPAEQLFTAGLLHDIGRLILYKKLPYASVQTLLCARENHIPVVEAEALVHGFEHPQVADELMRSWAFPPSLRAMVANHHHPAEAGELHREALVLQLADCTVNALEISEGGQFVVPPLEAGALEKLGITLEDLEEVITEFDREFDETAGAFLSG